MSFGPAPTKVNKLLSSIPTTTGLPLTALIAAPAGAAMVAKSTSSQSPQRNAVASDSAHSPSSDGIRSASASSPSPKQVDGAMRLRVGDKRPLATTSKVGGGDGRAATRFVSRPIPKYFRTPKVTFAEKRRLREQIQLENRILAQRHTGVRSRVDDTKPAAFASRSQLASERRRKAQHNSARIERENMNLLDSMQKVFERPTPIWIRQGAAAAGSQQGPQARHHADPAASTVTGSREKLRRTDAEVRSPSIAAA